MMVVNRIDGVMRGFYINLTEGYSAVKRNFAIGIPRGFLNGSRQLDDDQRCSIRRNFQIPKDTTQAVINKHTSTRPRMPKFTCSNHDQKPCFTPTAAVTT